MFYLIFVNHLMIGKLIQKKKRLTYVCFIFKILRSFNRHAKRSFQSNELFQKQMFTSVSDQSENAHNSMLKHSNSMNKLNPISCVSEDPFIVHPGAISSILQLLPAVPIDEDDQVSL